ncbi:MAG: diguanylate cyclase [Magnetococcales bacterium]|nr:diguanylate cyclase [Magnetococcales bacterium]MBF0148741.1 diguanylate cyclase [Magnetococcales bacterium]
MITIKSEMLNQIEGTILLVDDQPEQIDIIHSILEKNFLVKASIQGEFALQICNAGGIDLILLDVMMPGMDGYEVCRQLKNNPATQEIPVIFLTSKDTQNDEMVGLKLGAVDFIRKPSSPLVVLTRCRSTIAHQRAKKDLRQKIEELDKKNIQLQELNKILEDMATIDGLTGIPNRRKFDEYLIQEWNRALRDQTPISIIIIDIDFFKLFNDSYGHVVGDECLRKIAQTLASTMVRSIDLIARYGGEEFACILPNTDHVGLVIVCDQIRKNINLLCIPYEFSSVAKHVTISMGGATMVPSQNFSPYFLIGKADERLYKSKKSGRNRFVGE